MTQACAPFASALLIACTALAGCAASGDGGPVAWWHQLEGGRIAEARPAPPNADAPYPHLSTVPARPQATGPAERARIAGQLARDRANAEYAAGVSLSMPAASPPPAPPAAADGASASMPAASAAPRPAPTAPGRTAAPAAGASPAAMPDIPAAPPPPPSLPGVKLVTIPTPAPVAPPPAPPHLAAPAPGQPVPVAFPPASAVLSPAAATALRALAATRGAAPMSVIGFGDAPRGDMQAQSAALPLAWERAESMALALQRAGVPASALRLSAAAEGHGGIAAITD